MTNEYATKVLKRIQYGTTYPVYEALNMAIETLNFVSEHHQSNIETYAHDMGVSLEQAERELRVEELSCSEKPNRSDLISRTRLLTDLQETVEAWSKYPVMEEEIKGVEIAIGYVKNIPSANIDLSGYSDRLWKSAYDRGYERCKQDAIDAVDVKCLHRGIVKAIQEIIEDLPSAQPEIVRCKDCKYASPNGKYGCKAYHFKLYETHEMKADDYCSYAERRTDEQTD